MLVTKWLCENLLKVLGWTVDKTNPPVSNCVVIAAPHTSNWDFILMLLFAGAFGQKINWMGKSNLFVKPFGYLLRKIGGISVNRSQKNKIVGNMISLFKTRENFLLVVPVEGTRARANFWKSGFYHIAKGANVPILPTFLDYGKKRGGFVTRPFPDCYDKYVAPLVISFSRCLFHAHQAEPFSESSLFKIIHNRISFFARHFLKFHALA